MCIFVFLYAAGVDYSPLSETVTFLSSASDSRQCRNVVLLNDGLTEPDETFQVQIRDSVCTLLQTEATVTIIDEGSDVK